MSNRACRSDLRLSWRSETALTYDRLVGGGERDAERLMRPLPRQLEAELVHGRAEQGGELVGVRRPARAAAEVRDGRIRPEPQACQRRQDVAADGERLAAQVVGPQVLADLLMDARGGERARHAGHVGR